MDDYTTSNNENLFLIGRAILDVYRSCLRFSAAPLVIMVMQKLPDYFERNGYDLYLLTASGVSERFVRSVLEFNQCCYTYEGQVYNDAQNILFAEFRKGLSADAQYQENRPHRLLPGSQK